MVACVTVLLTQRTALALASEQIGLTNSSWHKDFSGDGGGDFSDFWDRLYLDGAAFQKDSEQQESRR